MVPRVPPWAHETVQRSWVIQPGNRQRPVEGRHLVLWRKSSGGVAIFHLRGHQRKSASDPRYTERASVSRCWSRRTLNGGWHTAKCSQRSTPTRAWYEAKESSARHIIASKTTKNETATGFQNRTSGASPDGQRATTTTVDQLPNEQGIICPVADKDRKEIGIHIPEVPARGVARFRRAPCAPTPTSGIVGTQATWHVMNANVTLVRRVSSSQTGMWSKSSKSDSIRGKRCLRAASTASLFWASGILTQIAGIRAAFSRQKSSMVALSFSMVR